MIPHPSTRPSRRRRHLAAVALPATLLLGAATASPAAAAPADQLIVQRDPIPGTLEKFDFYGWGLATGDFDGDGYDDLATSATDESLGSIAGAGAVIVVYGSRRGLVKADNQRFHQDTPGVPDRAEATDKFAETLAAGDFDGDGYDDLAVGVPAEDRGGITDVGIVQVLFGTPQGLRVRGTQLIDRAAAGIQGEPRDSDRFGGALATGDVDGDGRDDLVVGVPGDTVAGVDVAGSVSIVFGGRNGLTRRDVRVTQESAGVPDSAENGDSFGSAVAAGDLDGDGRADVAVGAASESVGATAGAGTVTVLFGTRAGVGAPLRILQSGWAGQTVDQSDGFGWSVAIGRHLKGVGQTLLVGAPGEENDTGWSGQAHVTRMGLVSPRDALGPVAGWRFGQLVAVCHARRNSMTFRSAPSANASFGGLDLTGGAVFGGALLNQDTGPGTPVLSDGFGLALSCGDYDRDGWLDAAVGIPFKDVGGKQEAGAVAVFYDPRPTPDV